VSDLPASVADGQGVIFRVADRGHRLDGVRLWVDVTVPVPRDFERRPWGWELRLADLPLDRIEYLFEIDGELVVDPGNPLRVGGAFGDHSWLPLAGYRPPEWAHTTPMPGTRRPLEVSDTPIGTVTGAIWSPEGTEPGEPLPLLVSHDGPEMDEYGGLTHYVGAQIARGRLPRLRVALLAPGERNRCYAANETYADSLIEHVLPTIQETWPSVPRPVLIGQSLGALAALHAAWQHPGALAGIFLQSGSFFTPSTDPQESGYSHWAEVCGFVRSVLDADHAPVGVPAMTLVCGTAEENLDNNRVMARHLDSLGLTVRWGDARDGHHWTCWRDLLDPHLTDLLARVWG
jgi:enterochelin esterase family protein